MTENRDQMKAMEREIPVFTVLKNNCVLKNIFVLDNPPPISSSSSVLGAGHGNQQPDMEEELLVGRHPDCHIKLEHPSISRFHLRIHSKPSSRSLFVTDLSSVHGTCVSGKRIEPGVKVELVQGDTLKLGESSRLYKLDWVPISFAYETNDSFVPQLDDVDTVEKETDGTIDQDENSLPHENEWGLSHSDKEGLGLSMQEMAEEATRSEHLYSTFPEKDEVENGHFLDKENEICTLSASFTLDEETAGVKDQDGDSSLHRNDEGLGWQFFEDLNLSIQESELHSSPEQDEADETCNKENEMSRWNAPFTVDGEAEGDGLGLSETMEHLEQPFCDQDLAVLVQKMSAPISALPEDEVENINSPQICEKENEFLSSQLYEIEKETSPLVHIPSIVLQKESQPETTECFETSSAKRPVLNIWSRRGKSESVSIETNISKANCERINIGSLVKPLLDEDCENKSMLKDQYSSPEIFTPDKENAPPNPCVVASLGSRFDEASKSRSVSCVDEDEEAFTSDKENMTPNGNLLRSFKKIGSTKTHSNLHKQSPLNTASHSTVLQDRTSTSSTSKSHSRSMKQSYVLKTEKRQPFLPLPVISTSDSDNNKPASVPSVHPATINYSKSEGVNQPHNWTIVVDTGCLLNKKSRRELQLLRGLRGTSLIIPRIVLRELDCMVRRASFLSRMTEASAALQWIEDCMASTKWWIHVQSAAEESRLVPPTPPSRSELDRGPFSVGSIPFSPYTLQEIVTPTAADHILDSALFFKQTATGQFVLLSDDVTLKIKAMAEGVICETAKEFRASLVNPFSSRFLYSDSSPRGATWTCLDDTVLKEKYYPSPSKKAVRPAEGAKGLKLILLHNSNFRQLRA